MLWHRVVLNTVCIATPTRSSPGEGVEEGVRDEVREGEGAVLEGTECLLEGRLELAVGGLKVELLSLQHKVGLEEALLRGSCRVLLLGETVP